MDIFELHSKMTKHLFPTFSSEDASFLSLALFGEIGELANMVKKQWRDNVDLRPKICEEMADIRVYTELFAKCIGTAGVRLEIGMTQMLPTIDPEANERYLTAMLGANSGAILGQIWGGEGDYDKDACVVYISTIRAALERLADLYEIGGKRLDHEVETKLAAVARKHGITGA